MLIQNYGVFWKREDVFWGKPNHAGHLCGVLSTNTTSVPVDFRDQQGVYVLYDDNFKVVYVGQAGANGLNKLFDRLKQHQKDSLADRWTRFSWFGIRWVTKKSELAAQAENSGSKNSEVLNHLEAILISAMEPPHNRQGGRFGESVQQYLQYRDEFALGPALPDMMKKLFEKSKAW